MEVNTGTPLICSKDEETKRLKVLLPLGLSIPRNNMLTFSWSSGRLLSDKLVRPLDPFFCPKSNITRSYIEGLVYSFWLYERRKSYPQDIHRHSLRRRLKQYENSTYPQVINRRLIHRISTGAGAYNF